VRRGAERNLERQARALDSPRPLHAFWELSCDPSGAALTMELAALANHRKAIQAELGAYAERFRRLQAEALSGALDEHDPDGLTPEGLAFLITSISQILAMEEKLGVATGHAELRALVERHLDRYEPPTIRR
jgi:hypothetical protein